MNPRSRRRQGRLLAVAGPTEGLGAEAALPGAAGNDSHEGVRRALPSADLIGVAGRDDGTQPLAAHLAAEYDVFGATEHDYRADLFRFLSDVFELPASEEQLVRIEEILQVREAVRERLFAVVPGAVG